MSAAFVCRRLLFAVIACAALIAAPALAQPITHAQPTLRIETLKIVTHRGVFRFKVEIADTPRSEEIGMMFRPRLAPDKGMLFEQSATPQDADYWMKNCPASLDILFIKADGTILTIARNTTPFSEAAILSGGPVTGVLEIRDGRAAEIGAAPGDLVQHPFFHHG
ncbi:MAG: DUF192 domain-containing protein [Caulobacterales bacterium]